MNIPNDEFADAMKELWENTRAELSAHEMEFKYARALAIEKAEALLKDVPPDE